MLSFSCTICQACHSQRKTSGNDFFYVKGQSGISGWLEKFVKDSKVREMLGNLITSA